mgnify:CR=1 FL=1
MMLMLMPMHADALMTWKQHVTTHSHMCLSNGVWQSYADEICTMLYVLIFHIHFSYYRCTGRNFVPAERRSSLFQTSPVYSQQ